MPTWILWVAVASLAGYLVGKKQQEQATAPTLAAGASPKDRYWQGNKEGLDAGTADGKAKLPSRVTVTRAQLEDVGRHPEAWVNDPDKAYALGYNFGYVEGYEKASRPPVLTPPIMSTPPSTPPLPLVPIEATPPISTEPVAPIEAVPVDATAVTEIAEPAAPPPPPVVDTAPFTAVTMGSSAVMDPQVPYWFRHPSFRRMR